jgi:hypothetical protein
VIAALIFRVDWVTLLIIAVLLALYEFGLSPQSQQMT